MPGVRALPMGRWWNLKQQRARYSVPNISNNIYHHNLVLDIGYPGTTIDNIY